MNDVADEDLERAIASLDQGKDDDENEDPAEEKPAEQAAHVPPPPPIKDAKKEKEDAKKKRGRPSGAIGRIPAGVDSPHEADLLWLDVLKRIGEEGISPHEMIIRVARVSPGNYQTLGNLEGSSVEGGNGEHDPMPSELLRDAVIDTFHIAQPGPAMYELAFVWKRGATFYDRGKLPLPSMREIDMTRAAIARRNGQQPPAYGPSRAPVGAGAPPAQHVPAQYPQPPQQPYVPPPPQYGPPPTQPQASDDPVVTLLREMRAEQVRIAARVEQVAAQQAAPPAPHAPPPQKTLLEMLREHKEMNDLLGRTGVGAPPAAPAAAPPPPPAPPQPPQTPVTPKTDQEILREALANMKKQDGMKREIADLLGVTLPEDTEEEEEEKKDPDAEKPPLGFHVHNIEGATWPDGSPMHHATDEKGNWDLGGLVLSNPYIISTFGSQLLKIVEKAVPQGLGGLVGGQKQQPAAQDLPEETQKNGTEADPKWKL